VVFFRLWNTNLGKNLKLTSRQMNIWEEIDKALENNGESGILERIQDVFLPQKFKYFRKARQAP